MNYLFVYGTLQRESRSPMATFLLRHAEVAERGYIYGRLYEVDSYPGAIPGNPGEGKVFGTLLKLRTPETVFRVLDEYEEIGEQYPEPHEYRRVVIPVITESGEEKPCWIYLYNHPVDNLEHIPSGDYISYRQFS